MSSLWATKEINDDFDREDIVRTTVCFSDDDDDHDHDDLDDHDDIDDHFDKEDIV